MMTVANTIDDADLERGIADDVGCRPPLLGRLRVVLAQPPNHVLHVDDRVVNERADGNRHPTERHRVDARAEGAQRENRRGERQRHRRQRDRGRPEVGQKQQHDDDDEDAAVAKRVDHVVDGYLDEVGLPEDVPVNGDAGRQLLLERVELAVQPLGDLDRVGARLLLHADDHRGLAAAGAFAALERGALADVGDVAHEDRTIAAQRDHRVADLRQACGRDRSPGARTPANLPCTHPRRCSRWRRAPPSSSSVSEMLFARSASGCAMTWNCRSAPPIGVTCETPGHREQAAADRRVGDRAQRQRIVGRPTRSRRTESRP